jgi:hypothetical protein
MRQAVGQLNPQPQSSSRKDPFWISIVAECEDENCKALTELIAIRLEGTTEHQILQELPIWNAKEIYCVNGHPIIVPRYSSRNTL